MTGRFAGRSRPIVVGLFAGMLVAVQVYAHDIPAKVPPQARERTNPVVRDQAAIEAGQALYTKWCVSCHGPSGRGDTLAAKALSHRPSDFSRSLRGQTDGALFWKITRGGGPMPSYEKTLGEEERWRVIHYLRTLEGTMEKKVR